MGCKKVEVEIDVQFRRENLREFKGLTRRWWEWPTFVLGKFQGFALASFTEGRTLFWLRGSKKGIVRAIPKNVHDELEALQVRDVLGSHLVGTPLGLL